MRTNQDWGNTRINACAHLVIVALFLQTILAEYFDPSDYNWSFDYFIYVADIPWVIVCVFSHWIAEFVRNTALDQVAGTIGVVFLLLVIPTSQPLRVNLKKKMFEKTPVFLHKCWKSPLIEVILILTVLHVASMPNACPAITTFGQLGSVRSATLLIDQRVRNLTTTTLVQEAAASGSKIPPKVFAIGLNEPDDYHQYLYQTLQESIPCTFGDPGPIILFFKNSRCSS